jgi:glutathione S-transferase
MPDLILHQYPESPFSEKIRLLLGYKKASYSAVKIPVIQPKPDFMAISGGYRKTPALQIGADIYCDSALMARVIDRLYPDNSIFPAAFEAVAGGMAHWTDTMLFKVCVAMAFQPRALGSQTLFADPAVAAAFMADRAEFGKGSTELSLDFAIAQPYFLLHLKRLDAQLAINPFLLGDAPTIVDFSNYHCLWFVHNNAALRDTFAPFPAVLAWMARMSEFGQGNITEMSGAAAIAVATKATPDLTPRIEAQQVDGFKAGDAVKITPIDYGLFPVHGKLLVASLEELAVVREDPQLGQTVVHFPRLGFKIEAA